MKVEIDVLEGDWLGIEMRALELGLSASGYLVGLYREDVVGVGDPKVVKDWAKEAIVND